MTNVALAPALRSQSLWSRRENLCVAVALHIFTFCSPSDSTQAGKVDRYFYRVYKQWLHNMHPDKYGSICQEHLHFYLKAAEEMTTRSAILTRLTEGCSLTPLGRDNILKKVTALALDCTESFHKCLQKKLFPTAYQKTILGFKDLEITTLSLRLHTTKTFTHREHFFAGDLFANCPRLSTLCVGAHDRSQLGLLLNSLPNFKTLTAVVLNTPGTWDKSLFAPLARCAQLRKLRLMSVKLDAAAIRELFALMPASVKVDIKDCAKS
jgi:hypothetical protein